jgi:hypothetical protein
MHLYLNTFGAGKLLSSFEFDNIDQNIKIRDLKYLYVKTISPHQHWNTVGPDWVDSRVSLYSLKLTNYIFNSNSSIHECGIVDGETIAVGVCTTLQL